MTDLTEDEIEGEEVEPIKAEDFTYILPEGYEFKPEDRAKIDAIMNRLGADNSDAQALIDVHVEILEAYAQELDKANAAAILKTNYAKPKEEIN